MKILAIEYFPTSSKGGSEKAYFEVLDSLSKKGHEITVAYINHGDLVERYKECGINTVKIHRTNIQNYFSYTEWKELFVSVKLIGGVFDVVYINYINDIPIAAMLKTYYKLKVYCHLRIPNFSICKQFILFGKFVNGFIFINEKQKKEYQNYFRKSKKYVVNDSIIFPQKKEQLLPSNRANITYVGRISPEKGIFELINCWQKALSITKSAKKLVITGSPTTDAEEQHYVQLKELVETLKLDKSVIFAKRIESPISYFENFELSIFPSICEETFGRTIVESVIAYTPVFARDIGITREILAPEEHKLIFKNDEDLIQKLIHFLNEGLNIDKDLLRDYADKNYNLKNNIDKIETILSN